MRLEMSFEICTFTKRSIAEYTEFSGISMFGSSMLQEVGRMFEGFGTGITFIRSFISMRSFEVISET